MSISNASAKLLSLVLTIGVLSSFLVKCNKMLLLKVTVLVTANCRKMATTCRIPSAPTQAKNLGVKEGQMLNRCVPGNINDGAWKSSFVLTQGVFKEVRQQCSWETYALLYVL